MKDLCARLPYSVIVEIISYGQEALKPWFGKLSCKDLDCFIHDIAYNSIKPFLRPMSSMTEEEKEEMHNLLSPEGTAIYENNGISLPINHYGEFVPYEFMNRIIQYLLKNHFDFMGLIPKGLAIEVTKDNNPYL